MRMLLIVFALILSTLSPATAAVGKYLNIALLTLPPRYLADVPMDKRVRLLTLLSMNMGKHSQLDYAKGWLHSDQVIEAAAYEGIERQDGRGMAYDFGKRELDLVWEEGAFRAGPPLGKEFTRDSE